MSSYIYTELKYLNLIFNFFFLFLYLEQMKQSKKHHGYYGSSINDDTKCRLIKHIELKTRQEWSHLTLAASASRIVYG